MNFLADIIVKAIDQKFKKEEFTQDKQDQIMIAEYEERKQAILTSDIPAFFSQDPSIF
jgi:hypothetical protein